MFKLPWIILVFSVAFTVTFLAPPLLSNPFAPYPLMKCGDVFDLLSPLIMLPLYWLLFLNCCENSPNQREILLFVILAGLWAMGQGMHLAANSIGHLLSPGSNAYDLTYFYDEVLSHYLWHSAVILLAVLLLVRGWRHFYDEGAGFSWLVILAGILHGITLGVIFIEGGTALLGILFTLFLILVIVIWGSNRLKTQPLVAFFFNSSVVGLLIMGGWVFFWGVWPIPQICDTLGIC